jgi:hypothetical protein
MPRFNRKKTMKRRVSRKKTQRRRRAHRGGFAALSEAFQNSMQMPPGMRMPPGMPMDPRMPMPPGMRMDPRMPMPPRMPAPAPAPKMPAPAPAPKMPAPAPAPRMPSPASPRMMPPAEISRVRSEIQSATNTYTNRLKDLDKGYSGQLKMLAERAARFDDSQYDKQNLKLAMDSTNPSQIINQINKILDNKL